MFLSLRDDYELSVDDYLEKGAQITMKKKKAPLPFISVVVLLASSLALLFKDSQKQQLYAAIALSGVVLLLLLYHVKSIHTESLLIIASVGVTVRQSSFLGTSSRFYEVQQIEDVVIIEAITMSKIVFQLVLLPKQKDHSNLIHDHSSTGNSVKCKDKLHPLFQNCEEKFNMHKQNLSLNFTHNLDQPKLKDLQTAYKHIQEKLIRPSQVAR